MKTVAGSSLNLCLAAQSYHKAGTKYLTVIWGHFQVTVTLQKNHISRLRNIFQLRSGREQEALLGKENSPFWAELRELSRHCGVQP